MMLLSLRYISYFIGIPSPDLVDNATMLVLYISILDDPSLNYLNEHTSGQQWKPSDHSDPEVPDSGASVSDLFSAVIQPGNINNLWKENTICLKGLKITVDFIKYIHNAELDNLSLGLSDEAIHWIQHPNHEQPGYSINDDLHTAIKLFLGNLSETTYETNRAIILKRLPGANISTYYRVGRIITEMTRIESVVHHMCINLCVIFTRPFFTLDKCLLCDKPWYDQFWLQLTHEK